MRLMLLALWLLAAIPATVQAQDEKVPNATVEGPTQNGIREYPWLHSLEPLKGKGFDYLEEEYFFGGTTTSLTSGQSAQYKTRMLVRLPRDPEDFSGELYVEWLNVTATHDLETGWPIPGGEFLMKRGIGYVAVSAQMVGVNGGQGSLKVWDPARYGSLVHPGDTLSYDIFAQAMQALREPGAVDPMRGMKVEHLVATGASQSAGYLTTFVNDGYARGLVDLFFITRGGGPYSDFSTPIVMLNEEDNEIPQPDGPNLVGWEEAGTAHAPVRFMDYAFGISDRDLAAPSALGLIAESCSINRGRVDYSARVLGDHITRYFETGELPPAAPRVKRSEAGAILRDKNGLALGGLRHTFVEVPVALNKGEECVLFGDYQPWATDKVTGLYPTHCDYVTKVREWADREVRQGWLLRQDRRDSLKEAVALTEPWPGEKFLAGGKARGRTLGPVTLGKPGRTEVYCTADGEGLRVRYRDDRAVSVLTKSRLFSVRGVRPGMRVKTLKRRLKDERRVRAGLYRAGIAAFRTRGKRVTAVGLSVAR